MKISPYTDFDEQRRLMKSFRIHALIWLVCSLIAALLLIGIQRKEMARLTAELALVRVCPTVQRLPPTDEQCSMWLMNSNLLAARDRVCEGVKK